MIFNQLDKAQKTLVAFKSISATESISVIITGVTIFWGNRMHLELDRTLDCASGSFDWTSISLLR
jgi:hypothetical protein